MLKEGMSFTVRSVVDETNTAIRCGSGDLPVFATPWMVALMEQAAMNAVSSALPEGSTTVGTKIDVNHTKGTALGRTVTAFAELTAVDGRKLVFRVQASDDAGMIGEGVHVRYIVNRERFLAKL